MKELMASPVVGAEENLFAVGKGTVYQGLELEWFLHEKYRGNF